jgi:hypothetical protein
LALCVECGNPPSTPGDYFKLENYLPSKFYDVEPGEIVQLHREIIAAHAKMAEHFGRLEAEERFIQQSQSEVINGNGKGYKYITRIVALLWRPFLSGT